MGKRKHLHPEARMERITAASTQRNDAIRERCATPGFGFLVLMCRPWGYGCTRYDTDTYAQAKEIAERELAAGGYECALIRQKTYDPKMMIVSSGPQDRGDGSGYDPYDADDL